MFNQDSIGKRVTSEKGQLGTIIAIDFNKKRPLVPLLVKFDNYPSRLWFLANGAIYTYCENPILFNNIRLFTNKQGTPEARKIVAMLASEYRKLCHSKRAINTHTKHYSNASGGIRSLYKVYHQAKRLLGENK